MQIKLKIFLATFIIFDFVCTSADAAGRWQLGAPVATYFVGPGFGGAPQNDISAQQIRNGEFNLVSCTEQELDAVHEYGLRAQLYAPELAYQANLMNDPEKIAALDALIERVKRHPAMYAYYIIDEPNASQFPAIGKLVAHLRERDPVHLAYINLFPTYANNDQLGTNVCVYPTVTKCAGSTIPRWPTAPRHCRITSTVPLPVIQGE